MQEIVASSLERTSIEVDGTVVIHLRSSNNDLVLLTLPPELVQSLAPTLARAKFQSSHSPEDEEFQAQVAASVRVLFHTPSARVIIRFDEGGDFESNFSLAPDQMPLFAQQVQDCIAFLKRRSPN